MKEFWQTCVSRLEQELPPQQISAWIRPLVPLAFDEAQAVLRVAAPNRFKLDWVRKNFSHQIEALATEWYQRPVQVQFELPSHGAAPRMPMTPRPSAAAPVPMPSAPPPAMPSAIARAGRLCWTMAACCRPTWCCRAWAPKPTMRWRAR
ncbi:DnaA N-terminal domain-containing protein, partial [Bordetella trematum]|uniref:DnaA N-terminal domain-containing protein n=1 Tax=Bordetella trematum TaxID=123899 RepID=UPI003D2C0E31